MLALLFSFLLFFSGLPYPLAEPAKARVLIFARTDCPITNRYAPELARIAQEFSKDDVRFWMVYPDPTETRESVNRHMAEYRLPGIAIIHTSKELQKLSQAAVSPQAAVFDEFGKLTYSGRIDNRFVAFGQARPLATVHDLERAISATLQHQPIPEPRTRAIGCYLSDVSR